MTFVYITLLSTLGERLSVRLRKALFKSIITQDISFFDTHKTGEIVNRYSHVSTCAVHALIFVSK